MAQALLVIALLLAPAWSQDLDGDGEVTFADFLAFVHSYGQTLTVEERLEGTWILTDYRCAQGPVKVSMAGFLGYCRGHVVLAMRLTPQGQAAPLMAVTLLGNASVRGSILEVVDGEERNTFVVRFVHKQLYLDMDAGEGYTMETVWERPQRDLAPMR